MIVKLTLSSDKVVYKMPRVFFDVRQSNSKPNPLVVFLNDL